jgi:hypothetical protein
MFSITYRRVEGGRKSREGLRMLLLVLGQQADSSGLGLGQFFGVQGLAGMDRLREGRRQAVGLQFGERGVENGFGGCPPMARSSFPAMRAHRPGVKARTRHPRVLAGAIDVTASVRC